MPSALYAEMRQQYNDLVSEYNELEKENQRLKDAIETSVSEIVKLIGEEGLMTSIGLVIALDIIREHCKAGK